MAVKTIYQLYDFVEQNAAFGINAHDLDGNTQTVINNANALRYILSRYGERKYAILTGAAAATKEDANRELQADFSMWLANRSHNIDRMYQALFDYDYSPIENVDRYETENTSVDDDVTYGKTLANSGTDRTNYGKTLTESGSDTTAFGKTLTNSGTDTTTYGKIETNTGQDSITDGGHDIFEKEGSHVVANEAAGFNSPNSYTPKDRMTEGWTNYEETTNFGKTETTSFGKRTANSGSDAVQHGHIETEGGSDSVTYGKIDTEGGSDSITYGKTETESGQDQRDITTGRTLHVHGNIGVTTNNQLIEQELEMRMKSLAEMLLDNFINDFTFYA